jgi:hypothetical protein
VLQVFLIEDFPVNLNASNTSVSQLELLGDRLGVGDYTRHWESGRSGLVVEANLVNGDNDRTALDTNADGELKLL